MTVDDGTDNEGIGSEGIGNVWVLAVKGLAL